MGASRAGRVVVFVLDAGNPDLVRRYIGEGHLPNFAHAMASGRTAVIEHEPGLYVGSVWPSAFTGLGVDRHGFFAGVRHAANSYDYVPAGIEGDPFWVDVSRAGRRVAVIDPPFFPVRRDIDADQIFEWGCHDRYYGTASSPLELLDEVLRNVGTHPIGMIDHEYERFAPCDFVQTTDGRRDNAQTVQFVRTLTDALDLRQKLSKHINSRARYDLVVDVISEVHCAGHQLWHLHDRSHPDHDEVLTEELGGDPLLPAYQQVDDLLGTYIAGMGGSDTVYVLVSHGMQDHFDGTMLLDEILWRLDQTYRGEPTPWRGDLTERLARIVDRVPGVRGERAARAFGPLVRRRLGSRSAEPTQRSDPPSAAERLWYILDNFTVCGAVRFNQVGREPRGLLGCGLSGDAAQWLIEELRSIVNVDTGEPAIEAAYLTQQIYERRNDDGLPDLIIEWNRSRPVDRVWSPAIGQIGYPYDGLRTGDHDRFGELHVLGPGIESGRRSGTIRGIDLAPTVAAATGVYLEDRDGVVLTDLVPTSRRPTMSTALEELDRRVPSPAEMSRRLASVRPDAIGALRREVLELRNELNGLKASHHETRVLAERACHTASLVADVAATSRWIAAQPISEQTLVSVIVPTRNRSDHLKAALRSVLLQSYSNLEVVVVDDGSDDDTTSVLAAHDEPRIRVFRNEERLGEGGARNRALDEVSGDIICFLDDDNTFDEDWVRSIVWLFGRSPDRSVAFGVRVVDDRDRHHRGATQGLPVLEQNEWDRQTNFERCLIDVNVLAHRPGAARFDPELRLFTDWDYLLQLTKDEDPVRLPAVATYYTTDDPSRVTIVNADRHDEFYRRVVDRWADGAT